MSRVKRTPLFGYDGDIGIPIRPQIGKMSLQASMEVELPSTKTGYAPAPPSKTGYAPATPSKNGYTPSAKKYAPAAPSTPSTPNKTVRNLDLDNLPKYLYFLRYIADSCSEVAQDSPGSRVVSRCCPDGLVLQLSYPLLK